MAVAENAGPVTEGKNLETSSNDPERSSSISWANSAVVNTDRVNPLSTDEFNSDDRVDHEPERDCYYEDERDGDDRLDAIGYSGDGNMSTKKCINSERKTQHEREMNELAEILSKLNPLAEEFVPRGNGQEVLGKGFAYVNNFAIQFTPGNDNSNRRSKNGNNQGRKRLNTRTSVAQRDEMIKRTVYVSDIDQQVTEEQLAGLFSAFGQVVDCRVCGDPNSILRFAFIEFTDEESAKTALKLSGAVLGYYPLRVLPSKTAIAPVNPTFLPRSEDEREMCARTIYCTNIDKKITQADVRHFFETFCGEVQRLRILGDYHHSTRIAFIEFTMAESAIAALSCSGAVLGSSPIRVSPSKTPVRPRSPRYQLH